MSSDAFMGELRLLFSRIIGFFVVERMVSNTVNGLFSDSEVRAVYE
jgi:hypothetical protein